MIFTSKPNNIEIICWPGGFWLICNDSLSQLYGSTHTLEISNSSFDSNSAMIKFFRSVSWSWYFVINSSTSFSTCSFSVLMISCPSLTFHHCDRMVQYGDFTVRDSSLYDTSCPFYLGGFVFSPFVQLRHCYHIALLWLQFIATYLFNCAFQAHIIHVLETSLWKKINHRKCDYF